VVIRTNPATPLLTESRDFATLLGHSDPLREFVRLPFAAPLYIMFSSGTTGVPKCIVHGVGGTLLQHQKEQLLHCDLAADQRLLFFTTCGWMMWNWLVSGLATGATVCLYRRLSVSSRSRRAAAIRG
jgi:acetoacetyl-CoA synthetase